MTNLNSHNIVNYIEDIFDRRGAESYLGEDVTMSQHMLQAAQCAEKSGADGSLIVAALLHDIGHYKNEIPETALAKGKNNYHEEAGANFLEDYFRGQLCHLRCLISPGESKSEPHRIYRVRPRIRFRWVRS